MGIYKKLRISKLEDLNHLVKNYTLSDTLKQCIDNELSAVIGYRLCGVRDLSTQKRF